MSVHIRRDLNPRGRAIRSVMTAPEYDIKSVGAKRANVRRERTSRSQEVGYNRESQNQANLARSVPLAATSRNYKKEENEEWEGIDDVTPQSSSASADAHFQYGGRRTVLPPILGATSIDLPSASEELCDVDEIKLKYALGKNLQSLQTETLKRIYAALQAIDTGRISALSSADISRTFKRYELNISPENQKLLFSKFISRKYPSRVDYPVLMSYLTKVKKLPVLDIPSLDKLARNHNKKKPPVPHENNRNSFMKQEELPVLYELKRQLLNGNTDLATLYRHVSETDRERKGVLTKEQVESVLRKNRITLTDNLLQSLLHYCDRDGYRLYSTTKFLDYFDRALKASNGPWGSGERPKRVSKVLSPPPRLPKPTLEETEPPPLPMPIFEPEEESDTEMEPPFDRNEWMRRYIFMARALHNCHQDNQGFLPAEEIQHITDTYNLVYNLQIPSSLVTRCMTQNYNRSTNEIDIGRYVTDLQDSYLRVANFG